MAQNIYDTPEFFAGYSQLDRSVHGLDGAAEWPAIQQQLPELNGKRVLDLGCGFGWFSRWARQNGAATVLGLDLSQNMIERAKAETTDAFITYEIANLEQLSLPPEAFDFAYSSLAFHYIKDFRKLISTIHNALVPGSHFVFTIEHPIYMAPEQPGWINGDGQRKTWPVNQYSIEGERTTDWLAKGVIKYHRTIGTTLNILINKGFKITHVEEWSPSEEQIERNPALLDEVERPMILLIHAER